MSIYLVQHGKALSKEENPERPLSEEGRQEVERMADFLKAADLTIRRIYHSGKTRAAETAGILAGRLNVARVEFLSGMAPNDDAAASAKTVDGNPDSLFVGHLPHLAKLASFLVSEDDSTDLVRFVNAGVLSLNRDNGTHHIAWYVTPALI